jgi:hypothetical protein
MLLKWIAIGFVKYFTNFWCWLDFIIVVVRQTIFGSISEHLSFTCSKTTWICLETDELRFGDNKCFP